MENIETMPAPQTLNSTMSPTIGKLALALSKAQAKIEGAKKDANNPFFNSQYADLASVWDASHKHLTDNELAVVQQPSSTFIDQHAVVITTTLIHSSGEWIQSTLSMPVIPQKGRDGRELPIGAQSYGSALTYARRYALSAMVGVCPIDDDGEGAMGRETQNTPATAKQEAKPTATQNTKKNRIAMMMKQLGLQPTTSTEEAWKHAVKSAFDLELVEANYDLLIERLEAQLNPQQA